ELLADQPAQGIARQRTRAGAPAGPLTDIPEPRVDIGESRRDDRVMFRAVVVTALLLILPRTAPGQTQSVLHITIVLADQSGAATPVPGHALLVSDNPATAAPRLIVTGRDGTADVRLRPGNYTVESDRPVTFRGTRYQ